MSLKLISSDRRFWPLFWTQFLGALNDNFFKNAIVMLITYRTVSFAGVGPSSLVALAGGVFIFPFFLFSATAGQMADRYEKSTMIRATKISELLIMFLAGVGLYLDHYGLLFIVLFCMGAQSAFFGPLKYGIIPHLLKTDRELVTGNAFVAGGTFVSILLGTIAGGLASMSSRSTIFVAAGVIFVSFLGILTSFKINKVNNQMKDIQVDFTLLISTWTIMKLTLREKGTFKAILGVSWFWFLGAAILSILPPLVKDYLHGSSAVATIFLAIFTIGMGSGAYLCDRLSGERVEVGMVPLAGFGMALFLVDMGWCSGYWPFESVALMGVKEFFKHFESWRLVIDLFLVSMFGGLFIIPQMCFIQKTTNKNELSRTIAGNNIWNTIFMVGAALLIMGLYSLNISAPSILIILGVLSLVAGIFLFANYSEWVWRFIGHFLAKSFYRIEVIGAENIPLKGGVILASNHVSYIDWMLLMSCVARPIRFVIDHRFYYAKGARFWFDQARLIPIATKKENELLMNEAFDRMVKDLDEGNILGIFPEGFVTRDGNIRRFQPGIKKIALRSQAVVVPVAICGLWGSFFDHSGKGPLRGAGLFRRRKISIKIARPIIPENFELKELELKIKELCSRASRSTEELRTK